MCGARLQGLHSDGAVVSDFLGGVWPQTLEIGDLRFTVSSLQEAQTVYARERDASGEGASTWPRGRVGSYEISYNGRAWLNGAPVSS
jgi:hypothetical protein